MDEPLLKMAWKRTIETMAKEFKDLIRALRRIMDKIYDAVEQRIRERRPMPGKPRQKPQQNLSFRRLSDVSGRKTSARAKAPRAETPAVVEPAPALDSDEPIYAIGDIHGRADLLKRLLDVIEEDCAEIEQQAHIIFLGDYIDRGFQSRQVISTLIELGENSKYKTTFLKGNHEQAMLHFMRDHKIGPDWASFGGRETLISYNVVPPKSVDMVDQWEPIQKSLKRRIPEEHVTFLETLAVSHQIGPYAFVHAGVKPGVPYEQQRDEDKLWIRDEFLNAQDKEDLFIVHGHTPVDTPYRDHRRVNVDTGAYFTGKLAAVKIYKDQMSFLTNESKGDTST